RQSGAHSGASPARSNRHRRAAMNGAAQSSFNDDQAGAEVRGAGQSYRRKIVIIRTTLLVGAASLLEAACRLRFIPASTLIPPSDMLRALLRLLATVAVWEAMLRTFTNVLISCAAAIVSGIGVGIVLHAIPRVRSVLEPVFSSYYAVPI